MKRRFGESEASRVLKLHKVNGDKEDDEEEGVSKIATTRVRIFPLGDVSSSMPSVGTRRSTRVFVPKSVKPSPDIESARVLRSGKRLPSDDEWLKFLDTPGAAVDFGRWKRDTNRWRHQEQQHQEEEVEEEEDAVFAEPKPDPLIPNISGNLRVEKIDDENESLPSSSLPSSSSDVGRFGIVYCRKRCRFKDPMYGIQFFRKQRRKKVISQHNQEAQFLEENPMRPRHPSSCWSSLLIFVEFSFATFSRFENFLISVLRWMMKSGSVLLSEFIAFLLSDPLSGVFSQNGIHFIAESDSKQCGTSMRDTLSTDAGNCRLYGAAAFVPLVSLEFSVLPFYFTRLHFDMFLGSLYLPSTLLIYLREVLKKQDIIVYKDCNSSILVEMGAYKNRFEISEGPTKRAFVDGVQTTTELTGKYVAFKRGVNFRKHKRRNSARLTRSPRYSPRRIPRSGVLFTEINGLVKLPSVVNTVGGTETLYKYHEAYRNNIFDSRVDYSTTFSPPKSNLTQKKSARYNLTEKIKELKSALIDIKQNIDSISCSANILVIESDRCWREQGAEILMDRSASKEWCLVVKTQGLTRYHHKAQEMRPSTCNRFTHAMMWTCENGWKLEFCDRKDWMVFKEQHKECCERNLHATSFRIIPVPGVREVIGYEDTDNIPFVRPGSYISVEGSEIQRALMSQNSNYDMDSGDEGWLVHLNCDFGEIENENDEARYISKDNFEKIISLFEKTAYSHPDEVFDERKATGLCLDLGRRDMVAAVFDYWMRKRKQRKSPLIKVFQAPPPKRPLVQKPIFRKKRSFKRQASQAARGGWSESFSYAGAKEDATRRVEEAKEAARKAIETAVVKRTRAQMLMQNADLWVYKSVMAVRIAEAAQVAEFNDDGSSLILW